MFALVVLFGLIHGLIFLPLCLSIIGPLPPDGDEKEQSAGKELTHLPPSSTSSSASSPATSHKADDKREANGL